ncbi:MAG TPA: ABC transporter permease [Clostridiales bacterium]|nr:ABC transporter permease [Clostridiales bacterium]
MWDNVGKSFAKAFELMGARDQILTEIVRTTMNMAFRSSIVAFLLGVPIGLLVAMNDFKGKKAIVAFMRTMMGLPAVAVGILVYMLFSGTGPFGHLKLIFSVKLMVIAQVILITPVVAGMTETSVSKSTDKILETARGLNLNPLKKFLLILNESKYQLIAIYMFAIARSLSEVGAVQIVGGNILHKTRVMTTAIALNYNMGEFALAVALGFILILIVLSINVVATLLQMTLEKTNK